MPEPEPSVPSEPALHEAEEHDHEHHEHEHTHDEDGASGVLKVQWWCGRKCADCMACTRRTKVGE